MILVSASAIAYTARPVRDRVPDSSDSTAIPSLHFHAVPYLLSYEIETGCCAANTLPDTGSSSALTVARRPRRRRVGAGAAGGPRGFGGGGQ